MDIQSYITPELFILVAFLIVLGKFLKDTPNIKKNKYIPLVLLGVSFLMTLAFSVYVMELGFSMKVLIRSIIQSVLVSGMAVYGNETFKDADGE